MSASKYEANRLSLQWDNKLNLFMVDLEWANGTQAVRCHDAEPRKALERAMWWFLASAPALNKASSA